MYVTDLVLGHRLKTIKANALIGNWDKVQRVSDITTSQMFVNKTNMDQATFFDIKEMLEMVAMFVLCGIEKFVVDEITMAQKKLQAFVMGKDLIFKRLKTPITEVDTIGELDGLPFDIKEMIARMTHRMNC